MARWNRTSESEEITVIKAPLRPPAHESDDPGVRQQETQGRHLLQVEDVLDDVREAALIPR